MINQQFFEKALFEMTSESKRAGLACRVRATVFCKIESSFECLLSSVVFNESTNEALLKCATALIALIKGNRSH